MGTGDSGGLERHIGKLSGNEIVEPVYELSEVNVRNNSDISMSGDSDRQYSEHSGCIYYDPEYVPVHGNCRDPEDIVMEEWEKSFNLGH